MAMVLNSTSLTASLSRFLHRYHIIVFAIVVLGASIVAIFLLNQVMASSDQANGYVAQTNSSAFDTATIKRVDELRTPSDPSIPVVLPQGRLNPFVEP